MNIDDLDSLSNEELFAAALAELETDDDTWNRPLAFLRRRGTQDVFDYVAPFAESDDPKERALSLDVLAQLGGGKAESERPYYQASVEIAMRHLTDSEPGVVQSAAWALSHLGSNEAVTALIALRNHPDEQVRWAIACGMQGVESPDAINTLIELTRDVDDRVRDWATFGLGSGCLHPVTTPAVLEALHQRLTDPFEDARLEAIWGLAKHKDPTGLTLLIERLESPDWVYGDEMAAKETLDLSGDTPVSELIEGLRRLLEAQR